MECDYCGLATEAVASWEVTTGEPGYGMTRYVCHLHKRAAERHVAQVGVVRVFRTNSSYWQRRAAA